MRIHAKFGWPLLGAVVFCIYAAALLHNGFRSEEQLRAEADARLVADSARRSATVGDFVLECRNTVADLAESREVANYLTNKALGMSPRYGLSANLDSIDELFRRKMAQITVRGEPVYNRISLFFEGNAGPLVDTVEGGAAPELPAPPGAADRPAVTIDLDRRLLVATAPVLQKGAVTGTIMATADIAQLSHYLMTSGLNARYFEALIGANGVQLPPGPGMAALPEAIAAAAADAPANVVTSIDAGGDFGKMLTVRTSIPGTELFLVTVLAEKAAYGHITSRLFLYSASAFPPVLLICVLMFERLRRRNAELKADFAESDRRRYELQDRNLLLSDEIARREQVEWELREKSRQLEHIAHYDALTGLPNRVLFADRLQQAIVQSRRRGLSLAVVYLDLDGFKGVNDQHGHDIGDELLILVAQRMKEALREGDTLARFGGDEFVAVLVDLEDQDDYQAVLARLLEVVAVPTTVRHRVLSVSASIGVTLHPQDGADADLLLRHADQAMYLAKQEGKNRWHLFDVAKDAAVKFQRESFERIRRALDQREFVLYYQPKVNMRTGEVIGAEALIRWQHPERGLLLPGAFLPIIEESQISEELGDWVIDTALTQVGEWHKAGLALPVSVNVGARQLQRPDFVPHLRDLLSVHPAVSPQDLELEIVETSALQDMALVSEIMHDCRTIGVRFALDDFGTCYSSLTYLKRLPAELLKIDRSFVRDMLDDPEDLAIVEGVVWLANAFGRAVIAEGVETVTHGELLVLLGCELAQGFGIARPMPGPDLVAWAQNWRPHPAWTVATRRPLHRLPTSDGEIVGRAPLGELRALHDEMIGTWRRLATGADDAQAPDAGGQQLNLTLE